MFFSFFFEFVLVEDEVFSFFVGLACSLNTDDDSLFCVCDGLGISDCGYLVVEGFFECACGGVPFCLPFQCLWVHVKDWDDPGVSNDLVVWVDLVH